MIDYNHTPKFELGEVYVVSAGGRLVQTVFIKAYLDPDCGEWKYQFRGSDGVIYVRQASFFKEKKRRLPPLKGTGI